MERNVYFGGKVLRGEVDVEGLDPWMFFIIIIIIIII
jgi:hypothetical protein